MHFNTKEIAFKTYVMYVCVCNVVYIYNNLSQLLFPIFAKNIKCLSLDHRRSLKSRDKIAGVQANKSVNKQSLYYCCLLFQFWLIAKILD